MNLVLGWGFDINIFQCGPRGRDFWLEHNFLGQFITNGRLGTNQLLAFCC